MGTFLTHLDQGAIRHRCPRPCQTKIGRMSPRLDYCGFKHQSGVLEIYQIGSDPDPRLALLPVEINSETNDYTIAP